MRPPLGEGSPDRRALPGALAALLLSWETALGLCRQQPSLVVLDLPYPLEAVMWFPASSEVKEASTEEEGALSKPHASDFSLQADDSYQGCRRGQVD